MKSIYVLSKLTNLKKYRQESGRKKKERKRERETGDIVQIGERENQSECERVKEWENEIENI